MPNNKLLIFYFRTWNSLNLPHLSTWHWSSCNYSDPKPWIFLGLSSKHIHCYHLGSSHDRLLPGLLECTLTGLSPSILSLLHSVLHRRARLILLKCKSYHVTDKSPPMASHPEGTYKASCDLNSICPSTLISHNSPGSSIPGPLASLFLELTKHCLSSLTFASPQLRTEAP